MLEFYTIRTSKNYPDDGTCLEVVWLGIFMPFDVIKGLDNCPPDRRNYKRFKKKNWWVCPRTMRDVCNIHDISMFMDLPPVQEFTSIDKAVKFCIKWRNNWLKEQLKLTQVKLGKNEKNSPNSEFKQSRS